MKTTPIVFSRVLVQITKSRRVNSLIRTLGASIPIYVIKTCSSVNFTFLSATYGMRVIAMMRNTITRVVRTCVLNEKVNGVSAGASPGIRSDPR